MNKRIRKKYAAIDASGVKEIARMQEYIDKLEEVLWYLFMFSRNKDGIQSVVNTLERNSATSMAVEALYEFIGKHREKKDEK